MSNRLIGSIFYSPVINDQVTNADYSEFKLTTFDPSQCLSSILNDTQLDFVSKLTSLKSGRFLVTNLYENGHARFTVLSSDLKNTLVSKYLVSFGLPEDEKSNTGAIFNQ